MVGAVLMVLFPSARAVFACQCERFSTCNEVAATNLVFIGTVESVEPKFLTRWNESSQSSLRSINDAFQQAREHPSQESLTALKNAYLRTFPDAAPEQKSQVLKARSAAGVAAAFYSNVGRGMRVHLRVQTLFKHEDDDDPKPAQTATKDAKADKDDNDAKADKDDKRDDKKSKTGDDDDRPGNTPAKPDEDFFDVWTPFGECGVNFQVGETYLVYAGDDEETSDSISTDACSRTRRLSDAGEDLAYLYFYKNHPETSTRIDGYATTNARYRLDFSPLHPERIQPLVGGVPILLRGDEVSRVIETDQNGHFVFDGLPAGDFTLTAYGGDYPRDTHVLSDPLPVHLAPRSCSLQILVLPKAPK
jgi:hypothetical protein